MNQSLVIFGILMVTGLAAFAEPQQLVPYAQACRIDQSDSHDLGPKMPNVPFSPYAGQCMNTEDRRSADVLLEDPDDGPAGSITFANFYHDGKFWTATMKKDSIRQVIFQIEPFDGPSLLPIPQGPRPKLAHTQLRFVTSPDKPLVLHSQGKSMKETTTTVDTFVVSFEAIAPPGAGYDLLKGILNNYDMVGRVLSWETRQSEQEYRDKIHVDEYPLRMTQVGAQAVAEAAIYDSAKLGYFNTYNTITNNCTTETFKVLDQELTYQNKKLNNYPFVISSLAILDPIIGPSLDALQERDLIRSRTPVLVGEHFVER